MEGHSPRCICLLCVLRRTSKHHKLVVPCRFNLLNSCKFSCDECRFTHYEYDEIPPCRNGVNCRFGPTKCLFLHDSFEGDGNTDENLPQNNTEHAVKEQPAGSTKKKKRKKKKKKNNNKSRLVESKQDSQSSQNPFQPLLVEEIEVAESDSESEGESESDSPSETNQVSSPLANVVDEPIPVSKSSPFEEVTDSVNTPSSDEKSFVEEEEKKEVENDPPPQFSITERPMVPGGQIHPYCAHCQITRVINITLNQPGYLGKCFDCSRSQLPYYWFHPENDDCLDCPFTKIDICYDCIGKYYNLHAPNAFDGTYTNR